MSELATVYTMYTVQCDSCGEVFVAPEDHDPDLLYWCDDVECQWEGAETDAAHETRHALWNENVMARYRKEMTSSELAQAQYALVAVVKANWL